MNKNNEKDRVTMVVKMLMMVRTESGAEIGDGDITGDKVSEDGG